MSRIYFTPGEPRRPFYDDEGYRIRNPYLTKVLDEFPERLVHPNVAISRKGHWNEWTKGKPLHVEIGPGKGRFITQYALRNPEIVALAIENKFQRVYRVSKKLAHAGALNGYVLRFDGNFLDTVFAPGEVSKVLLQFPDPWWKKSKWKQKRMVTPGFLAQLHSILEPGGIFEVKTDHQDYFSEMLELLADTPFEITRQTRDLVNSEYAQNNIETIFEEKFRERGIPACYLNATK